MSIPDGDPIPGMYPGTKILIKNGDDEVEDTVHSVRYRSAEPEILKRPTGWRKLVRQLTPLRWRKPLPISRPYRPAETEVILVSEVGRRAAIVAEDMERTLNRLLG